MDVFRPNSPGAGGVPDPRLQPTPDYGTLGPDSDLAKTPLPVGPGSGVSGNANSSQRPTANLRIQLFAMILGAGVAFLASSGAWKKTSIKPRKDSAVSSANFSDRDLDGQRPQRQAEILLERAVNRSSGATDQIDARVDNWRGKLKWDSQLGNLTSAALNSSDQSVRSSAIEVQLAAYGLPKNESSVDSLARQVESSDHAQKIWALWSLGLLGNRGIQTERVVQVLTGKVNGTGKDSNEDARRWAVEALALVGTTPTIAPLLDAMHNDLSPMVRERAACSLAESGMLTHEQRLIAVPQLINYSDDPALDGQTHSWAFQALKDITKQSLPNDSAAWRSWYQSQGTNN